MGISLPSHSQQERSQRSTSFMFRMSGSTASTTAVGMLLRNRFCSSRPLKTLSELKTLAVPTTAGSGSEATRFAVLYRRGRKLSISDESCLPSAVLFDPSALDTLPDYPKKAAMLDALCHGVESYWSVYSTGESRGYSRRALQLLLAGWEGYLNGDSGSGSDMLRAAYLAGKAINIAKTTAGHAMCYQLTSRYGAAHGHAAALCVSALWPYMLEHIQDCIDPRGPAYLCGIFQEIADAMGCDTPEQAAERFQILLQGLGLRPPAAESAAFDRLTASVAPERLCNHPIMLDSSAIKALYRRICIPPERFEPDFRAVHE